MELEARSPVVVESALLQEEEELKPKIESLLPHRTLAETPPSFESAGVEDSVVAEGPVEARAAVKAEAEEVEEEDTYTEMIVVPARRTAAIVLSEDEEEEEEEEEDESECSSSPRQQPTTSTIAGFPSPGDHFATSDDFFAACRAGSLPTTGYGMGRCLNQPKYALSTCSSRTLYGCRARCAIRRSDEGDWVVQREPYILEHNHSGEHLDRLRRVKKPLTAGSPPKKADLAAYRVAFPGVCPPIPDLPQPGDAFPSLDAVLFAARSAMVPITGTSLRKERSSYIRYKFICHHTAANSPWKQVSSCAFAIVCAEQGDGRWKVESKSCYEHDHGRDARIINDPSWRPAISRTKRYDETEDLKELRNIELASSQLPSASRPSTKSSLAPISKRPRLSLAFDTLRDSSQPKQESKPKLSAHAKPRHSLPARLPSSVLSRSPAPPLPTPAPSPFLPTLTTFLASLHPSLSTSASILDDAGVRDHALLVAFLALEDSTRESFLADANMPLLQKHLLKAKIKQAREGEWGTAA